MFGRLLYLLPKKFYLVTSIIIIILLSLTTILLSYFLQGMLDATVDKDMSKFIYTLYFVLGIALFEIVFAYIKTKFLGNYSEAGIAKLRDRYADKLNKTELAKLATNHTGDYVSRATNDVNKIKSFIESTLPSLISIPITGILAFIYLIILNWKLTLISLALVPILVIGSQLLSIPLGKVSKRLQEKLALVNILVQDFIKGVEVSKAYNLENVLENSYNNSVEDSIKISNDLSKRKAILSSFSEFLSIIPFFITFFMGGYYVIQDEMSIGALLAFINLLNHVTFPIGQMPRLIAQSKINLAACSRVFEVLDYPEERIDGNFFETNDIENIITFKDVTFTYPGKNEAVLENINFSINKGEKVAIVGPSGGGKSTIIKLLLGYYNNINGSIKIFNEEIQDWNLVCLREKIALVSQDTFLFPESIEENISYGNINRSKDDIICSAKLANASNFIESFPSNYKTQIGELGNRLSGGQKQRISIARAILKDSDILLLDEATSALDNESESLVQDALNKLMINKTSIIIAHRLSTIKNVDRILVINDGKLVEEGTHDYLMSLNGLYKDLYSKQLKSDNQEGEVA